MKNRVRSLSMQWAVMTGLAALALSGKASAQFIGAEPRAAYVRGASDPIHKGDVVLRDLDVSLIGAAGHTGIFLGALTAGGPPMVVEAMNEPLQPNSGERAASGHFMNPASVLVQQQSVQINPFHTQFNEKGEIVQLGFVRPRGDAPRRKDGTYEWLRYYGARFGLRVHQEVSRGWQWSTRQQLSQLADWAVRERSFGTELRCVGHPHSLRVHSRCLREVCSGESGAQSHLSGDCSDPILRSFPMRYFGHCVLELHKSVHQCRPISECLDGGRHALDAR